MANDGQRKYCRCIASMSIVIGNVSEILFKQSEVYQCVIRTSDTQANFFKIYGEEFALSCSDEEFKKHFIIIKNKKTSGS